MKIDLLIILFHKFKLDINIMWPSGLCREDRKNEEEYG